MAASASVASAASHCRHAARMRGSTRTLAGSRPSSEGGSPASAMVFGWMGVEGSIGRFESRGRDKPDTGRKLRADVVREIVEQLPQLGAALRRSRDHKLTSTLGKHHGEPVACLDDALDEDHLSHFNAHAENIKTHT